MYKRQQQRDPRPALIEALYTQRQLGLSYDTSVTRNAAQAFSARAGNCLSLVIMTAAFAKHLGLPVSYRSVEADIFYTREGDLTMASGHVNLVLDRLGPLPRAASRLTPAPTAHEAMLVDFLPPQELRGTRSVTLSERTVLAMFMNNRAAEALNEGRLDDSYAWARAAVRQDPEFKAAVNTLGVVYLRAGHRPQAEAALRAVLAQDADNVAALSNLVRLVQQDGRQAEARQLGERLARLEPYPPFHFFDLGRAAMAEGNYAGAQKLFDRELGRQPTPQEVAKAARVPLAKLNQMHRYLMGQPLSLDRPIHDDDERALGDMLADPETEDANPAEDITTTALSKQVRSLMGELSPIEADVIRKRFGLGDDEERTFREIGDQYHLSRERIRQIQNSALGKLKKALGDEHIGPVSYTHLTLPTSDLV